MYADMAALEGVSLRSVAGAITAPWRLVGRGAVGAARWMREHPKAALAIGGAIVATGAIIATGGTASPIVGAALGAGKWLGGAALTVGKGALKAGEAVASVIPMPGEQPRPGGGKGYTAAGSPKGEGKGIWLLVGGGLVLVAVLMMTRKRRRK